VPLKSDRQSTAPNAQLAAPQQLAGVVSYRALDLSVLGGLQMSRVWLVMAALALAASACSKDEPPRLTTAVKATATKPKEYEIRLNKPAKVGERREIQLTATLGKVIQSKQIGQEPLAKSDKYEIFFKGSGRTLAVDDQQHETKIEITVDRFFLKQSDGSQITVLNAGAVVVGEIMKGTTRYRDAMGESLPESADILLPKLFPLHTQAMAKLFPTEARHAVGGRWPIDKEAAGPTLRTLAPDLLPDAIAAEHVAGGAQLLRTVTVDGVECLEIRLSIVVELPAAPNPPKGMKGAPSSFQFTSNQTLPAANASGPLKKSTEVKIRSKFQGVPGTMEDGTTIELQVNEAIEEKIKYLPAK
jgi:hypothetical protein